MKNSTISNRPVSFTTSDEQYFNLYMKEVRRHKPLTAEEEKALSATIKAGGKEGEKAYDRLVNSNLRLGLSVAKQRHVMGVDLADVVQNANIGLTKAARLYDGERDVRFSTFAVSFINDAITDGYEQLGIIHLPKYIRDAQRNYRRFVEDVLQKEGRRPTIEEFEEASNLSHETVLSVVYAQNPVDSLDKSIDSDEEKEMPLWSTISYDDSESDCCASIDSFDKEDAMNRLTTCLKSRRKAEFVFDRLGVDGYGLSWGELEMKYGKSREALQKEFGRIREALQCMCA